MTKLKIAGAVFITVGALATSAGVFAYQPAGPKELEPPAQTVSGLEKPVREARAKIVAKSVSDERAQQDEVVFETQLKAAVNNASKEQLVKAALRLGNKEALLRALSAANESREREERVRENED